MTNIAKFLGINTSFFIAWKLACQLVVLLLLTSYISVFVGLVIMNFLALFYLLILNENNIKITCWPFILDR